MDLIVKAKNIDLEYNGRQILNIDNLEILLNVYKFDIDVMLKNIINLRTKLLQK